MYVPLHVHSYYSFLSSPASVEDLVGAASRFGMPGIAITDYDGIYSAVPFYKAAQKRGIKPILGAEVSLDDGSRIVLLIKNGVGYRNLSRLITFLIDHPEGISRQAVANHREGLLCLSGCRKGPPARGILARQGEKAVQEATGFREIFAEDFFLEMHWGPDSRDRWLLSEIAALGRRVGVACLAVPNAHYVDPADEMLYRILVSIRTGTALHYRHPEKELRLSLDLPGPAEMARRFRDYPEVLENTFRAAERCELPLSLGRTIFPHFPLPEGESAASYLRKLCFAGAVERYGDLSEPIRERLEYELRIIQQVGYSEYFLMTWDICREAHRRGIWAVARGSAADSMVCYALGISHVCPVRYNLYFERFLNPERMIHSGLADIDLDLPWDRRDEMVEYVYQRYGADHCATICSMVRMHARTAIGEVGKVLGLAEREIRSLTKRLPYGSAERLEEKIHVLPECSDLPVDREPLRTLLAIAKCLEGAPRHTGMHPCGLVVSRQPLTDLVPLQKSAKGPIVTQFDMEPVEELGLVKIDLLGQAGLTVISETIETIRQQHGIEINPYEIPEDDPKTWELIAGGQARGCFQIESPAMCNLLKMLNCRDMECLIAALSIIRPGASNHGKMRQFSRRYQGIEPVTYPHPALKPVLERTYGVMVYEEHVLMIAHAFAGMNLGRADLLRRALTKWNCRNTVEEFEAEFRRGARAKGYADKEIDTVWRYITEFSGYAFNKAHSASYAILAYQAAYLKAHYPAAFLAAALSSGRGFYSRFVYTLEARQLGIGFLLPDFNASDAARFTVEGNQIRVPLEQVKDVPGRVARQIVAERGVRGPFKSPEDLMRRVRMDPAVLRALIRCGAGDSWGVPRPALLWEMESLTRRPTRAGTCNASSPQMSLFEPENEARFAMLRGHRDYPFRRKMEIEMESLGFTVSGHPLDYYDGYLDWRPYTPIVSLPQYPNATVTICGTIVERRATKTLKGEYMKFVSVADRTGIAELVLFPPVYHQYGRLTAGNGVLEYHGTLEPFENRNGFVVNVHAVRTVLPSPTPV